jgi:ketosteroid isomerase-like protein
VTDLTALAHRVYAAFAERDFETIAETCHPDCEFTSLTMESEGTVYRGHDGLREFLDRLLDVLPDWRPEVEEVEEYGDRGLVKARIYATPSGGSVSVEQTMWQVVRFRDGLAIRWDFFRTEEEARAALGEEPSAPAG